MLTTCRNCGKEISIDARFCPSCGTPLFGVVSDYRFLGSSSAQPAEPETFRISGVSRTDSLRPPRELVGTSAQELANYIRPVNSRLLESHENQPTIVYAINMGDYAIGATIPQIACEAVGGRASDAFDLAYAYSLGLIAGRIYDDMMDRTIERREKRTVWREFGDPVAIPVGFQLISEMFEALSVYNHTLGRDAADRIAGIFRDAMVESARSEEKEKLSMRSDSALTFRERVMLAQGKRGMLIAAGTAGGAIVGSGTEEEIELLRNYGLFTGTANQLFDDSTDPNYPRSYRESALSESRDLTAKAIKCTDKLRPTEAQRKLRDLCKISEIPLI